METDAQIQGVLVGQKRPKEYNTYKLSEWVLMQTYDLTWVQKKQCVIFCSKPDLRLSLLGCIHLSPTSNNRNTIIHLQVRTSTWPAHNSGNEINVHVFKLITYFMMIIKEGFGNQIGWIFGKVLKGGRGSFSIKIFMLQILGTLHRAFWS